MTLASRIRVVIVASTLLWGACGGSPPSPGPMTIYTPEPPADVSGHSYHLSGTVRSADTNAGLVGATVSIVAGWNSGQSTTTDGTGRYFLALAGSSYTIAVSASGYVSTQQDLTVGAGGLTADFTLLPTPR